MVSQEPVCSAGFLSLKAHSVVGAPFLLFENCTKKSKTPLGEQDTRSESYYSKNHLDRIRRHMVTLCQEGCSSRRWEKGVVCYEEAKIQNSKNTER